MMALRRYLFRPLGLLAVIVTGLACGYFLAAIGLGVAPLHREAANPPGEIEIFVVGNGYHTDVLLPVNAAGIDWRARHPVSDFAAAAPEASHIAFGWGDRAFYLETPRLADVRWRTAVAALVGAGPAVMHVGYHWRPGPGERVRRVLLDEARYLRLVAYLRRWFVEDRNGMPVKLDAAGYGGADAFYAAHGRYNAVFTCNEWLAQGFRQAGITAPRWSPFSYFLLLHL